MTWLRDLVGGMRLVGEAWAISRLLRRRCDCRRDERLIRRKADGTLWAAGAPQNFAYAMRGLFLRGSCDRFHFYRVREWRGLLVASRRVFWLPVSGDFELLATATLFVLPPWAEAVECAKLDAAA
jgi:hypothetical protein